jgi:predicted enzyme related to lactoylglutathione lyase
MIVKEHAPGSFCWAELSTPDPASAKQFYAALFGWEFADNDAGAAGVYTMCRLGGDEVGGMCKTSARQEQMKVPPHWGTFVAVASVDDVVVKAKALGATVLAPAFDVMNVGRMAVIQDPTGAVFSAWQGKEHKGYARVNEVGAVCWNEVETRDVDAAQKFYTALFGYRAEHMGEGPTRYTVFMNGEKAAGGMMAIEKGMEHVPPHWLVYFAVKDCDGTVAKAKASGGSVAFGPMDIPGTGRFAVVLDPQCAAFGILQPVAR